jgi:hypothetical protein
MAQATEQDIERLRALWTLGKLSAKDLPPFAWQALELGYDGPALRRLAAFESPTFFEIGDLFEKVNREMGRHPMAKRDAAILLAKEIAGKVLSREKERLTGAYEIFLLGYDSGMPDEIMLFGGLDQDFDIPTIYQECKGLLEQQS